MKTIKKVLAVVLAVVTVCAAFVGCSKSKANNLVVGVTDYQPIDYKDENGEWTGFDAEFAKAVAKELGYDGVEFVSIVWDNKFTELNSGTIDCIWNGMTIDDSVKENCDVSDNYASNSQVVVMKKDALAKYATTDTLKGIQIAVEKGSAGEAQAKLLTDADKIIPLSSQADTLKEVKAGTADACIIDSTMANSMTADGTDFSDLGYTLSLTTEYYGVGFKKGSDLTAKVNEQIAKMKTDGTLDELSKKYGVDIAK